MLLISRTRQKWWGVISKLDDKNLPLTCLLSPPNLPSSFLLSLFLPPSLLSFLPPSFHSSLPPFLPPSLLSSLSLWPLIKPATLLRGCCGKNWGRLQERSARNWDPGSNNQWRITSCQQPREWCQKWIPPQPQSNLEMTIGLASFAAYERSWSRNASQLCLDFKPYKLWHKEYAILSHC